MIKNLIFLIMTAMTAAGCNSTIEGYIGESTPKPSPSTPGNPSTPGTPSTPSAPSAPSSAVNTITISPGAGVAVGSQVRSKHSVSVSQRVLQGNQIRATLNLNHVDNN